MLIDTNVWSELTRKRPDAAVDAWMIRNFDRCMLSTIVLGEIRYGIALAQGARQRDLQAFHDDVLVRLGSRIVDFDDSAAASWGQLRARLRRAGQLFGERDMLIAAHAMSLGVPLVTRNVAEMSQSGADIINPWQP
ncbi:tRNA(fMet)-specific endonuclease VapC [Hephaestia caeni]|uniref:Ribonuclease VapC n=1 Tax=Hephaestia caeni TaxID=645617 RepID=A0A397NN69_9SPHN|nr:PIN domain-containing protein [Hephaestia caeni]RIA36697.1 tRNA(fMet)-specific endonuclease VapC [Hephaestia caeni]